MHNPLNARVEEAVNVAERILTDTADGWGDDTYERYRSWHQGCRGRPPEDWRNSWIDNAIRYIHLKHGFKKERSHRLKTKHDDPAKVTDKTASACWIVAEALKRVDRNCPAAKKLTRTLLNQARKGSLERNLEKILEAGDTRSDWMLRIAESVVTLATGLSNLRPLTSHEAASLNASIEVWETLHNSPARPGRKAHAEHCRAITTRVLEEHGLDPKEGLEFLNDKILNAIWEFQSQPVL
jgi:hypothetical protein